MSNIYFHDEATHNKNAPAVIVPILSDLLEFKSVLDVGCGIGTWLSVFKETAGIEILGLDGDYVDRQLLKKNISLEYFRSQDLTASFSLGKKFDLALCLEVAEHLPPSSADNLVDSLCRHADQIVFSAAVPDQGGQNHLNEQWPSYWVEKFNKQGFEVYDLIRPLIWNNSSVDSWYRQNILVFSKKAISGREPGALDLILPEYWNQKNKEITVLKNQLERIKSGKVGVFFYLKSLFKSFKFGGKKV